MWKRALTLRKTSRSLWIRRQSSATRSDTEGEDTPPASPLPPPQSQPEPQQPLLPELTPSPPQPTETLPLPHVPKPFPTEEDIERGYPLIFTVKDEFIFPWEKKALTEIESYTDEDHDEFEMIKEWIHVIPITSSSEGIHPGGGESPLLSPPAVSTRRRRDGFLPTKTRNVIGIRVSSQRSQQLKLTQSQAYSS